MNCATFIFHPAVQCTLGSHIGTVRVSVDGVPIGRIDFLINVVEQVSEYQVVPVSDRARRYRKCFCSYASGDSVEALKRIQGINATGLETFVDVLTLRPGDRWSDEIFAAIDDSDLFVVMWSQNARQSDWVKKEALYALQREEKYNCPDFRPIPIEGPPIPPVPAELNSRHFNDPMLGAIRAAELARDTMDQCKKNSHGS